MEKNELNNYLRECCRVSNPEKITEKILKYENLYQLSFAAGDVVLTYGDNFFDVVPSIKGYRKSINISLLRSLIVVPLFENSKVTYENDDVVIESLVSEKVIGAIGVISYAGQKRIVHIYRQEMKEENEYWETAPTSKLLNACEKECYRAVIPNLLYIDKNLSFTYEKEIDKKLEIAREFASNETFRRAVFKNKRMSEYTQAEINDLYEVVLKERALRQEREAESLIKEIDKETPSLIKEIDKEPPSLIKEIDKGSQSSTKEIDKETQQHSPDTVTTEEA